MISLLNSNKELNFDSLEDFFSKCNYWYIVGAFGFFLLFVLFEALSLHVILKKFGYKPKISSSIAYSTSDIYYSALHNRREQQRMQISPLYQVSRRIQARMSCDNAQF